MKRQLTAIALCAELSSASAQFSTKIDAGALLRFPGAQATASADIEYNYSPWIALCMAGEIYIPSIKDHPVESNISAMIKLGKEYHPARIVAGFGWGHTFTTDVTDHNFHTYSLGLESRLLRLTDNTYVTATPMCQWRTYAEHIGFSTQYFRLSVKLGITHKF